MLGGGLPGGLGIGPFSGIDARIEGLVVGHA
jgi:hypothetical protein